MGGIRLSGQMAAAVAEPMITYSRWDGYNEFEGWDVQSVYGVPVNGGAPVKLSNGSEYSHEQVEVSPDRLSCVFGQDYGQHYRIDFESPLVETLIFSPTAFPFGINTRARWKPDGSMIVWQNLQQFPLPGGKATLYATPSNGGVDTILKQFVPSIGSFGDWGYSYDGSIVLYVDSATDTLWSVEDDGTNATNLGTAITGGNYHRLTPGHISDVVVWIDPTTREIKKCALDGSGVTVIETIGPNDYRTSNHMLAGDDSAIYYTYDTEDWHNGDGYWTSEIGKDSEVFRVPLDGSGQVSTGIWTYCEYGHGNLSNNPVDVPHLFGDRFYISYNTVADGGTWPSGDVNDYRFASFALDGSDARIEDNTPNTDTGGGEDPYNTWVRITMEPAIDG